MSTNIIGRLKIAVVIAWIATILLLRFVVLTPPPADAAGPFDTDACAIVLLELIDEADGIELRIYEDATATVLTADDDALDLFAAVQWINSLPDDVRMQEGCAS